MPSKPFRSLNKHRLAFLLTISTICFSDIDTVSARLERKRAIAAFPHAKHGRDHVLPAGLDILSECASSDGEFAACHSSDSRIEFDGNDAPVDDSALTQNCEGPNCPAIFTVIISGTNTDVSSATDAITVTISGALSQSPAVTATGGLASSVPTHSPGSPHSGTNATATTSGGSFTFSTSGITTGTTSFSDSSQAIATQSFTSVTSAPFTTSSSSPASVSSSSPPSSSSSSSSTTGNLQTFTGVLGGIAAPVVTASNGKFQVQGNSQFDKIQDALGRSCDIQHNACADAANASGNKAFKVNDCDSQQKGCKAVAAGG